MAEPTVALFHRELGGEGPPLVLLHGLLGSSRNWQTTGRDLAAHYRVLALDLRNHGASPQAEAMDYPTLVADVVAWMDRLGLAAVSCLGHSLGGKVAMLMACRHPERMARLGVVDVAPKDYHWTGHRADFAAMRGLELDGLRSRAEAEMRMEGQVPDWAMRKFLTTNLERVDGGGWRWTVNLAALTQALPILERNPLEVGDRYAGPTRFILGGRSNYVAAEDRPAVLAHFPNADFVAIPTAGHNPHMDARAEFVHAATPPWSGG